MKIRLICPTRELDENYDTRTPLGRSLSLCPKLLDLDHKVERRVFGLTTKRTLGADIIPLPRLFNIAIEEAKSDPSILVFIHDDIEMRDFFWPYHVVDGLGRFDLVGLAGNMRRVPNQSMWGGMDRMHPDKGTISGIVGHRYSDGIVQINCFGLPFRRVQFLDGLFLAAHSDTFHKHNIRFDEQFAFHFYDMDICRQFESKNLVMGTIGISLIHDVRERHNIDQGYNDPEWSKTYKKYIDKWKF